jgi:pimeloyl-ACP methyl ester carboxylesterase
VTFAAIFGVTVAIAADYKVPSHHPGVEKIARDIAYFGGNTPGGPGMAADPELRDAVKRQGLVFREGIDDEKTGTQAMVLQDPKTKQTYIAFRGTWPNKREGALDAITDADHGGDTGSSQYDAHKDRLAGWAEKYPNSVVTGHSLGAALGQRFIADHPGAVKEGVLFNAPAVATKHGHQLARAEKQPPVTIYVGKTQTYDAYVPGYDIVSELGGRTHLPAKIVEVTQTERHTGLVNVLGTSHTAFMLSGKSKRKIEEIPYSEYQERREDSWRNAEDLMRLTRQAVTAAEGLAGTAAALSPALSVAGRAIATRIPQSTQLAGAIAGIAHGFGRDGPAAPTPAMREAGDRDCTGSLGYAERARKGLQGAITAQKISEAELYLRWARERSAGCPDGLARIASVEAVRGAALEALRTRLQSNVASCDAQVLQAARQDAMAFKGRPGFDDLAVELSAKAVGIAATKERLASHAPAYRAALQSGSLDAMRSAMKLALDAIRDARDPACHAETKTVLDSNLQKANNLKTQMVAADEAIAACNTDEINRQTQIFRTGKSTVAAKVIERLKVAGKKCSALHNTQCETVNGPGWSFTKMANDGKNLTCVPNQAAANAYCDEVNKTTGMTARNIKSDGSMDCQKDRAQLVREAEAECRDQFGTRFIRVEWNSQGVLGCRHCNKGEVARGSQCYSTARAPAPQPQRQPQHDPRNSAAAAAAAAAVIQGVIGAVNSNRSGSSSRTPGYQQPQVHRQPTPSRTPGPVCRSHNRSTSQYFQNQTDPRCR